MPQIKASLNETNTKAMREILFRGKDTYNSQWHYGYVYHDQYFDGRFSCVDRMIIRNDCDEDYTVKENSIGQFIGLTDKNGVKIFEGDIIECMFSTG